MGGAHPDVRAPTRLAARKQGGQVQERPPFGSTSIKWRA